MIDAALRVLLAPVALRWGRAWALLVLLALSAVLVRALRPRRRHALRAVALGAAAPLCAPGGTYDVHEEAPDAGLDALLGVRDAGAAAALEQERVRVRLRPGESLAGTRRGDLCVVLAGRVRVSVPAEALGPSHSSDGAPYDQRSAAPTIRKRPPVAIADAGPGAVVSSLVDVLAVFGGGALPEETDHCVAALCESTIAVIPVAAMQRLASARPDVAAQAARVLLARLQRVTLGTMGAALGLVAEAASVDAALDRPACELASLGSLGVRSAASLRQPADQHGPFDGAFWPLFYPSTATRHGPVDEPPKGPGGNSIGADAQPLETEGMGKQPDELGQASVSGIDEMPKMPPPVHDPPVLSEHRPGGHARSASMRPATSHNEACDAPLLPRIEDIVPGERDPAPQRIAEALTRMRRPQRSAVQAAVLAHVCAALGVPTSAIGRLGILGRGDANDAAFSRLAERVGLRIVTAGGVLQRQGERMPGLYVLLHGGLHVCMASGADACCAEGGHCASCGLAYAQAADQAVSSGSAAVEPRGIDLASRGTSPGGRAGAHVRPRGQPVVDRDRGAGFGSSGDSSPQRETSRDPSLGGDRSPQREVCRDPNLGGDRSPQREMSRDPGSSGDKSPQRDTSCNSNPFGDRSPQRETNYSLRTDKDASPKRRPAPPTRCDSVPGGSRRSETGPSIAGSHAEKENAPMDTQPATAPSVSAHPTQRRAPTPHLTQPMGGCACGIVDRRGALVGVLAAAAGQGASATARVSAPCALVAVLDHRGVDALLERLPEAVCLLAKRAAAAACPLARVLDVGVQWRRVGPGGIIVKRGDEAADVFVVQRGRVRAARDPPLDYAAGAAFGCGADAVWAATHAATRDTEVAALPKRLLAAVSSVRPGVAAQLARLAQSAPSDGPRTVAVVPADSGLEDATLAFAERLYEELAMRDAGVAVIDAAAAAAHLGRHAFGDPQRASDWLRQTEAAHSLVLLVADAPGYWLSTAVSTADVILVLAQAADAARASRLGAGERAVLRSRSLARVELVLLHPVVSCVPGTAQAWLVPRPFVCAHHHVCLGTAPAGARPARPSAFGRRLRAAARDALDAIRKRAFDPWASQSADALRGALGAFRGALESLVANGSNLLDDGILGGLVPDGAMVPDASVLHGIVADAALLRERVRDSTLVNRMVSDASSLREKVRDSALVNRVVSDASSIRERVRDSSLVNRVVSDASSIREMVRDSSLLSRVVSDASSIRSRVQNSAILSRIASDAALLRRVIADPTVRRMVLQNPALLCRLAADRETLARITGAAETPGRLADGQDDVARVARILLGRAVGFVLGGGGARGIAHLGVIRALTDAGVPVDAVGGTSMGALVSALYAADRDVYAAHGRARRFCARMAARWRHALDLTYPLASWFSGAAFNAAVSGAIGPAADVRDLWLPFFCVSTDIAAGRAVVHTAGSAWRFVRASMSLCGFLPPMCAPGGALLVDGGYVDNLPVDAMLGRDDASAGAGTHVSGPVVPVGRGAASDCRAAPGLEGACAPIYATTEKAGATQDGAYAPPDAEGACAPIYATTEKAGASPAAPNAAVESFAPPRRAPASTVVAVDVALPYETRLDDYGDSLSGVWLGLQALLRSLPLVRAALPPLRIPTLPEIQSRLAYIGNTGRALRVQAAAAAPGSRVLYLSPGVAPWGVLDFGDFGRIYDAGYACGRAAAARWARDGTLRLLTGLRDTAAAGAVPGDLLDQVSPLSPAVHVRRRRSV